MLNHQSSECEIHITVPLIFASLSQLEENQIYVLLCILKEVFIGFSLLAGNIFSKLIQSIFSTSIEKETFRFQTFPNKLSDFMGC